MILEETLVGLEFGTGAGIGEKMYVFIKTHAFCVFFFAELSPAICFLAQGFGCLETLARSVKLSFKKAVSGCSL